VSRGKSGEASGYLGIGVSEVKRLETFQVLNHRRSPSRGSQGGHASEDPREVGDQRIGIPEYEESIASGIAIS
jgi:hypothetical protein